MEQKIQAMKSAQKPTARQPQEGLPEAEEGAPAAPPLGILDGALAEARLIDWPSLPSARRRWPSPRGGKPHVASPTPLPDLLAVRKGGTAGA